jgi:hypothetical protein
MANQELAEIEKERHEVERGHILRYLCLIGMKAATPRLVREFLYRRGYATSREGMEFHLNYLSEKGLVELEVQPGTIDAPQKIVAVKITPGGIDLLDGRKTGDSGVRF